MHKLASFRFFGHICFESYFLVCLYIISNLNEYQAAVELLAEFAFPDRKQETFLLFITPYTPISLISVTAKSIFFKSNSGKLHSAESLRCSNVCTGAPSDFVYHRKLRLKCCHSLRDGGVY